MAISIIQLRRQAIEAGMPREEARREKDRVVLLEIIAAGYADNGTKKPAAVKKAVKKAVVAKKKQPAKKATPVKRGPGRPKGSTTKKATPTRSSRNSNGNAGRATIGKVDYTVEDDAWKPREGSPVETIWKALKRSRDNVERAFEILLPSINELVHKHKNDGTLRSKAEREATLKYRINRTRFEYAVRTGQHKSSTNRVEYGTGDYAQPKKAAPVRKSSRTATKATRKPAQRKPANTRRTSTAANRKKKVVRR
jgi:hypothetical protein